MEVSPSRQAHAVTHILWFYVQFDGLHWAAAYRNRAAATAASILLLCAKCKRNTNKPESEAAANKASPEIDFVMVDVVGRTMAQFLLLLLSPPGNTRMPIAERVTRVWDLWARQSPHINMHLTGGVEI